MDIMNLITGVSVLAFAVSILIMVMIRDKHPHAKEFLMGLNITCIVVLVLCIISYIGTGISTVTNAIFGR